MARPKDLVSLSPPPSLRPRLPTGQIFQDTLFREFPSNDVSLAAHRNRCVAPTMPCLSPGLAWGQGDGSPLRDPASQIKGCEEVSLNQLLSEEQVRAAEMADTPSSRQVRWLRNDGLHSLLGAFVGGISLHTRIDTAGQACPGGPAA